jgi:hypothetical protein
MDYVDSASAVAFVCMGLNRSSLAQRQLLPALHPVAATGRTNSLPKVPLLRSCLEQAATVLNQAQVKKISREKQ